MVYPKKGHWKCDITVFRTWAASKLPTLVNWHVNCNHRTHFQLSLKYSVDLDTLLHSIHYLNSEIYENLYLYLGEVCRVINSCRTLKSPKNHPPSIVMVGCLPSWCCLSSAGSLLIGSVCLPQCCGVNDGPCQRWRASPLLHILPLTDSCSYLLWATPKDCLCHGRATSPSKGEKKTLGRKSLMLLPGHWECECWPRNKHKTLSLASDRLHWKGWIAVGYTPVQVNRGGFF